jgi:hypothetical protein
MGGMYAPIPTKVPQPVAGPIYHPLRLPVTSFRRGCRAGGKRTLATGNFFNPQWFGLVEGYGATAWQTNFVRYRDVSKHFREEATYASSSKCRIDIESTAHGYDLMAEGIERHGSMPPVGGRVDAVVVTQSADQPDVSPAKKAATPPLQANTESPGPAS